MARIKFPRMIEEFVTKYRQITHFAIGPYTVFIHVWRDPSKKWVPMRYKASDTKLEVDINGFPMEWQEMISIAEVSTEKPMNAPQDPMRKDGPQLDDDSSIEY